MLGRPLVDFPLLRTCRCPLRLCPIRSPLSALRPRADRTAIATACRTRLSPRRPLVRAPTRRATYLRARERAEPPPAAALRAGGGGACPARWRAAPPPISRPPPPHPCTPPPAPARCAPPADKKPLHGRTIRNTGEHQSKNPEGRTGEFVEDAKVPLNTDEITVEGSTPLPSAEAAPAAPPAPEVKTQTLEEYERAKAALRQGALFSVVEEDKSKLEAQFSGKKPVRAGMAPAARRRPSPTPHPPPIGPRPLTSRLPPPPSLPSARRLALTTPTPSTSPSSS